MTDKTVRTLSWEAVHHDLQRLADRLQDQGPWQGIVAVTRGGLVPAAILARALDIRLIDTVCITSYRGQEQGPVEILKEPERARQNKGADWLLVDDIVDTGATVRAIRHLLPHAFFVTLYAKAETKYLIDAFRHEVDAHIWIEFPWEN
jgi:xanthine phosphoribosyltransferase